MANDMNNTIGGILVGQNDTGAFGRGNLKQYKINIQATRIFSETPVCTYTSSLAISQMVPFCIAQENQQSHAIFPLAGARLCFFFLPANFACTSYSAALLVNLSSSPTYYCSLINTKQDLISKSRMYYCCLINTGHELISTPPM